MSVKQQQDPCYLPPTKELQEVHFEFPFILIGKSTMAFLTGQSWHVLKSQYTGGGPEQGFWHCLQMNLTRVEFCLWCRLPFPIPPQKNMLTNYFITL